MHLLLIKNLTIPSTDPSKTFAIRYVYNVSASDPPHSLALSFSLDSVMFHLNIHDFITKRSWRKITHSESAAIQLEGTVLKRRLFYMYSLSSDEISSLHFTDDTYQSETIFTS